MKLKIIIASLAAITVFSSCEAILKIDPVSQISNDNFWVAQDDVQGCLNGMYNLYRSMMNTTLYGADRSEELAEGHVGSVSSAWGNQLRIQDGLSWKTPYNILHHANLLLKYTPDIKFTNENEKNRCMAEGYYFRASIYLLLIQSWGDVPKITAPTESHKQPMVGRSPALEIMDEIILPDIEEAIRLFPSSTIENRNRISKAAAYALKANALAWRYKALKSQNAEDLVEGIKAIEEIEKVNVQLINDYASIFSSTNKVNQEIIFSLNLDINQWTTHLYASRISPSVLSIGDAANKEDIPYSKGGAAKHDYAPSPELIAYLNKYANDKRKPVSYVEARKADNTVILASQNKFRGRIQDDDRVFDDDMIIYRLSDMILLKAEMLADKGGADVALAITELNRVRNRAGIGDYSGATDQLSVQKEILEERARELCFENKRWPDLLRAHFAGIVDVYELVPNLANGVITYRTPLYFPITQAMIDLNTSLTQTEGYVN